jgi:hypothetical protein
MVVVVLISSVGCLGGSGVRLGLGLVWNWLLTNDRRLGRSSVLLARAGVLGLLLSGVFGLLLSRVFGLLSKVLRLLSGVLGLLSVLLLRLLNRGRRHSIGTKVASVGVDGLDVGSPGSELVFGDVQDFSCSLGVRECGVDISRNDRSVVNEVEQLSCVLGQQDLLLGALDDSGGVKVVGLLELLAGDVGKLGLGDEGLSLCADELLLEGDNLDRAGLLVLELLDLVGNLNSSVSMLACRVRVFRTDLGLLVTRGLDGRLGVADLLENTSALLETWSQDVLLLGNLSKQDTKLVWNLRDGVVTGLLTPVTELRGDVGLLLGSSLVCANGVVLGLDQAVKLLGEISLLVATKTGHGEAVLVGRFLAALVLRPNGERTVPVEGIRYEQE